MLISHMVWIDLIWEGIRYNGHKENIIPPLMGAIKGYDNISDEAHGKAFISHAYCTLSIKSCKN